MIITENREFKKILEEIGRQGKIFIVGCAACATKCNTGGEKEVDEIKIKIENSGNKITGSIILDTPCDERIVKKELSNKKELKNTNVLLILACGAGVQSVSKVIALTVVPGLNPVFVGTTERIGRFFEYCSLCGDCILGITAGLCPNTRCAKSLRNGPCGGAVEGKCEVNQDNDCVWVLIYEKLGEDGIMKILSPRKYSKTQKPQRILK